MASEIANTRLSQLKSHIIQADPPPVPNSPNTHTPTASSSSSATTTTTSPRTKSPPPIILIFGWGGSTLQNLQKYILKYRELYPGAVIFPFPGPFMRFAPWPVRTAEQRERGFEEGVAAILGSRGQNDEDDEEGKVIIHSFSNSGAYSAALFAERYLRTSGGERLPLTGMIFDSGIERTSVSGKAYTISQSFRVGRVSQLLLQFVLFVCLAVDRVFTILTWQREATIWTYAVLNDERVVRREARRTYIFSKEDRVMDWREVVGHAEVAREGGFGDGKGVRLVEIEGGEHVQHVKRDEGRYWRAVREVVDG